MEFRLGRWQEVLTDVGSVDVLASDPPYSARTHEGFRTGADIRQRDGIAYEPLQPGDIEAFVAAWAPRVRHWAILFGDHTSYRAWEAAWDAAGWVTFAPVVWLKTNAPPRFSGDGPQSSAEYLCVARPRGRVREHGGRPGFYIVQTVSPLGPVRPTGVIGTKDVAGLRRLLADYTRPGDVVADPFGGGASMGEACVRTGRRYVGAECDPATFAIGRRRLDLALADPVVHDRWAQGRQRALFPAEGTEGR